MTDWDEVVGEKEQDPRDRALEGIIEYQRTVMWPAIDEAVANEIFKDTDKKGLNDGEAI